MEKEVDEEAGLGLVRMIKKRKRQEPGYERLHQGLGGGGQEGLQHEGHNERG